MVKKQQIIKVITCSLALCTVLSLCGCGNSTAQNSQTSSAVSTQASSNDASSADESTTTESNSDETSSDESSTQQYTLGTIVDSGECGNDVTYKLDENGLLVISGNGEMSPGSPWYDKHRNDIKTVVIQSGVTSIGSQAFLQCGNLTTVIIPETVKSIKRQAFDNCSDLTSITLPEGLESIGEKAFNYCIRLTSITIPKSVTRISRCAFRDWESSQTIYIKNKKSVSTEWQSTWNKYCEAKIEWNA